VSAAPRVLRHPRAERDIEEQVEYYLLVERAPAVAARLVDAVERGLERLQRHPEAGAPVEAASPRLAELRRWPVPGFENHLVFYRASGRGVEIVRILHGARDLGARLAEEG